MSDSGSLIQQVADLMLQNQCRLSVVESCTGGGLGEALTSVPGASEWFLGGFIAYSNATKMKQVYVRESTLETEGAVSEACVKEMANGGMIATDSDVCLSISGIAGPDGETETKPLGTVWIGLAVRHQGIEAHEYHFDGDRDQVRQQAVEAALQLLASLKIKKTV